LRLEPAAEAEWLFVGSYFPTRRVFGVFSFGARSCHTIFSGGFWDAGVKKDATAVATEHVNLLVR
jgi:hypothetical protein